jgi:hypothetical protein
MQWQPRRKGVGHQVRTVEQDLAVATVGGVAAARDEWVAAAGDGDGRHAEAPGQPDPLW